MVRETSSTGETIEGLARTFKSQNLSPAFRNEALALALMINIPMEHELKNKTKTAMEGKVWDCAMSVGPPIPAEIIKPAREWVQQDMDLDASCRSNEAIWKQMRLTDYSNKTSDGATLGTEMDVMEVDVMARPLVFFNYLPSQSLYVRETNDEELWTLMECYNRWISPFCGDNLPTLGRAKLDFERAKMPAEYIEEILVLLKNLRRLEEHATKTHVVVNDNETMEEETVPETPESGFAPETPESEVVPETPENDVDQGKEANIDTPAGSPWEYTQPENGTTANATKEPDTENTDGTPTQDPPDTSDAQANQQENIANELPTNGDENPQNENINQASNSTQATVERVGDWRRQIDNQETQMVLEMESNWLKKRSDQEEKRKQLEANEAVCLDEESENFALKVAKMRNKVRKQKKQNRQLRQNELELIKERTRLTQLLAEKTAETESARKSKEMWEERLEEEKEKLRARRQAVQKEIDAYSDESADETGSRTGDMIEIENMIRNQTKTYDPNQRHIEPFPEGNKDRRTAAEVIIQSVLQMNVPPEDRSSLDHIATVVKTIEQQTQVLASTMNQAEAARESIFREKTRRREAIMNLSLREREKIVDVEAGKTNDFRFYADECERIYNKRVEMEEKARKIAESALKFFEKNLHDTHDPDLVVNMTRMKINAKLYHTQCRMNRDDAKMRHTRALLDYSKQRDNNSQVIAAALDANMNDEMKQLVESASGPEFKAEATKLTGELKRIADKTSELSIRLREAKENRLKLENESRSAEKASLIKIQEEEEARIKAMKLDLEKESDKTRAAWKNLGQTEQTRQKDSKGKRKGKNKAKKKAKKMPKAQETMDKNLLESRNDSGDETDEAVTYTYNELISDSDSDFQIEHYKEGHDSDNDEESKHTGLTSSEDESDDQEDDDEGNDGTGNDSEGHGEGDGDGDGDGGGDGNDDGDDDGEGEGNDDGDGDTDGDGDGDGDGNGDGDGDGEEHKDDAGDEENEDESEEEEEEEDNDTIQLMSEDVGTSTNRRGGKRGAIRKGNAKKAAPKRREQMGNVSFGPNKKTRSLLIDNNQPSPHGDLGRRRFQQTNPPRGIKVDGDNDPEMTMVAFPVHWLTKTWKRQEKGYKWSPYYMSPWSPLHLRHCQFDDPEFAKKKLTDKEAVGVAVQRLKNDYEKRDPNHQSAVMITGSKSQWQRMMFRTYDVEFGEETDDDSTAVEDNDDDNDDDRPPDANDRSMGRRYYYGICNQCHFNGELELTKGDTEPDCCKKKAKKSNRKN